MSIIQMGMVWQLPDSVPPTHRFVLLALADNANDDGMCWPGLNHVCSKTGYARRTIQVAIAALVDAKLMSVERRKRNDGSCSSNTYQLHLSASTRAPHALPPSAPHAPTDAPEAPLEPSLNHQYLETSEDSSVPRKAARPPADSRIPEFIRWFCGRFKEVKNAEYVVVHGRDQKLVKQMLFALPPEELRQRAEVMFEHPFWGIKSGLGVLLAHANEFIPVPCDHTSHTVVAGLYRCNDCKAVFDEATKTWQKEGARDGENVPAGY